MTAIQDVADKIEALNVTIEAINAKKKSITDQKTLKQAADDLITVYKAELDILLADSTAQLKSLRDSLVAAYGASG